MSGQNLPAPVRPDPAMLKLIEQAQKAERYDFVVKMLKEIELLEGDIGRQRRSRARMAALNTVALEAKIAEIKLLISAVIG